MISFNNPWVIVAAIVAGNGIIMYLLLVILIFYYIMYRSPKKRTRECTNRKDDSQMRMFTEGISWAEQFKGITEQLRIVNDGLYQYGEYINFGYDKCAIILQGRGESLLYCYYFADVYVKNGYNILVTDVRAHGLSDGKYLTAGIKESDDLVLWIKLINEKYQINDFTLHGICVGASAAIYSYVKLKNSGSDLVKRIVTDGLFYSFYELFKCHIKRFKQPSFPVLHSIFFLTFLFTGARLFSETPVKYMKDIDIPILFIWSARDIFCIKSKGEELFNACASKYKEVCFFPEGRHSHVRSTQEAEYDNLIAKFLKKHI